MADKRDANEKELVSVWRQMHCHWIPMDRNAGFDGVLITPGGGIHIVEVKNPARKWSLTDAEKQTKAEVEARGGSYHVIESVDDAVALVNRR